MPELPEVETLKRYLEKSLIGKTIIKLKQNRINLRYKLEKELESRVQSAKIVNLMRRAKYFILNLDNDYSLIIHLGMSGRFTLQPYNYQSQKHDHLIFYLDNLEQLVFNDARRFGMVYLFQTANLLEQKIFKNLGPEPLSNKYNADYLQSSLSNKKTPIKNALMDNNIIVGIGNIYASESLFLAKIHPQRFSRSLSYEEISRLVIASKTILEKAILAGGTTLRDFVNGDSSPGYFKQELLVYGRDGKPCYNCGTAIVKIKQAGRATFYCPECSKY